MFERPPFQKCFACGKPDGSGILWVGNHTLERRCRYCRNIVHTPLPDTDKKVIYLDQLAVSEIFKTKRKSRKAGAPHEGFWTRAHELCDQVLALQQAIFPASSIHRDESLVFKDGDQLRLMHEMLSGDVALQDVNEVELHQIWEHLEAYLNDRHPAISFDVDEVLDGDKDVWLPDLHITANMDWSQFVDDLRKDRESAAASMQPVYDRWASSKASFDDILKEELEAFGGSRASGYAASVQRMMDAIVADDIAALTGNVMHPLRIEFFQITQKLLDVGVAESDAPREVIRFWSWPENRNLPFHRIKAHLFASLARKVANGQKKITRGMMNDINAIATYAPYVDAMFLDNECANFLREEPLASTLGFKAQIFSLNSGEKFLEYLSELAGHADDETQRYAQEIYGLA